MPPQHEDSDVVAAALELIDDVFSSSDAQQLLRRRRFSRRDQEAQQLRTQIDQLEQLVKATRRSDASSMTRVWARIALRQRRQRENGERLNTTLRDATEYQRACTQEIVQALAVVSTLPSITMPIVSGERVFRPLPSMWMVPPVLAERLASAERLAFANPLETSCSKARRVTWSPLRDAVQLLTRVTDAYPFKLSTVASELWRMLLQTSGKDDTGRNQDHYVGHLRFSKFKPFGCLMIEGHTVMRRTVTADGDVVIVCAALTTGPLADENVMSGLEMLDYAWMRIARRDRANPRSLVIVDSESETDVRCAGDKSLGVASRLQRVLAFIEQCIRDDDGRGQQAMENRLLQATVSNRGIEV